jgi:hypothetical protein
VNRLDFTLLELAVLYSALIRYEEFCASCLENPENKGEFGKIRGEIMAIQTLIKRLKSAYLAKGGDIAWLR